MVEREFLRALRHNKAHGAALLMGATVEGDGKSMQPWLTNDKRPVDAYVLMLGPLVARMRAALDAKP